MQLARASLRASAREIQRQAPRIRHAQSKTHDFSVLATVNWDPDRAQFTSSSSNPLLSPGLIQCNRWKKFPSPWVSQNNLQQIRFKRHDRASRKPRPQTQKQRQKYNRKIKIQADEKAKHSAPGTHAGPRRQWRKERIQELLDYGKGDSNELLDPNAADLEYGYEDALLEDLMGNSAHLTSQPTPEPIYWGHKHKQFYNKVANQMDRYREAIEARRSKEKDDHELLDVSSEEGLPSDKSISMVLRSYRDRHGSRTQPIGIVKALQHLLKDLGIPTAAFEERTYTTLLTCCRTPKEARRIFKLMNDHQHPISAYSWSILVDIHAKLGDFEGCEQVIKEMASEGVPPTQAAYTSLLAACYKVCNDGRIPHSIRAKAGELGWRQWQEMIIVGIEPDVMAYGAIIRLCTARGRPERAISLLEDMARFDVKPTTLCFSSALRAVARSHEIAIRFERGSSRKQLRRENFAAHHGGMARKIVIMAENAEVELDDGFISALMLCSAAAGDSATTKAIYLAGEVRRMDHLRTIGPDSSLGLLRGETIPGTPSDLGLGNGQCTKLPQGERFGSHDEEENVLLTNRDHSSAIQPSRISQRGLPPELQSYAEREYGKDSRPLSALLRSCAQAMNSNMIGTIWAGKQNQGYLCENSLRLITTRWEPSYKNTGFPGVSTTKVGIGALRRYDENERDDERKPGVRKKFRGLYVDDDAVFTADESDDAIEEALIENVDIDHEDSFFDDTTFKKEPVGSATVADNSHLDTNDFDEGTVGEKPDDVDALFEDDIDDISSDDSELFNGFFSELKEEASRNGEDFDLTEEDAREFFRMMQEEYAEALEDDGTGHTFEDDEQMPEKHDNVESIDPSFLLGGAGSDTNIDEMGDIEEIIGQMKNELDDYDHEKDRESNASKFASIFENANDLSNQETAVGAPEIKARDDSSRASSTNQPMVQESSNHSEGALPSGFDSFEVEKIKDLQNALPGMPLSRVKKILKAFDTTLSYPSLITLVPILRETMPDYISSGWLKRINSKNADFVLRKASENGLVDTPILNTMIQVKTSGGSLDEALAFYNEQFKEYQKKPTGYSDRMILQMLVENKRLPRVHAFKQKIENEGRNLDLPSYGSLVEYYARHDQLGSAMMLLKECLALHGAPPSEKYLKNLRIISRQKNMENEIRLTDLIGEDPLEWLKHGEKYLKREKSKKGRRNVQLARNRMLS